VFVYHSAILHNNQYITAQVIATAPQLMGRRLVGGRDTHTFGSTHLVCSCGG